MSRERSVPAEALGAVTETEFAADRRPAVARLAREVALPIAVFLVPLVAIVLIQCRTFGCELLLGWDSSTYAWWAVQVQENGVPAMVLRWNYPHLYVLLLSAFGSAIGSVTTAEQILPLLVSVPLGYSYYVLATRITSDRRLGLFAAFLGGVSMATLEMVSDIQRNLLAYGIALLLGGSIHLDLAGTASTPSNLRTRTLLLWLLLLFVVVATQVETYAVLSIALLVGFAASRRWSTLLRGVALLAAPVLLVAPILAGYLLRYTAETSRILPLSPSDMVAWTWLYLSGFALPLAAVGVVSTMRAVRRDNPTARYLMLWLLALGILVPAAVVLGVPPTRLLFLVPLPVLLAVAVPDVGRWIATAGRGLRARIRRVARSQSDPDGEADPPAFSSARRRWPVGLVAAFLLAATPVLVNTALNKDQLRPYIAEADVERVWIAAAVLRDAGFRDAILVLYGPDAALFAPIYRAYFGIRMPDNLAYYGKLQHLFALPDPEDAYNWKYDPPVEATYARSYRGEILETIGVAGIRSHAIVIAGGATYGAALSEVFLGRFESAPGIFVIPPGALTDPEVDTWRLFADGDCFRCDDGSSNTTGWSNAATVLEHVDLSSSAAFEATYVVSLARGWATANLTIRFWDFPGNLTAPSGTEVVLAPLDVSLDGTRVVSHPYAGTGPLEVSVTVGPLDPGIHRVVVRASSPGLGVAVQLDELGLVPVA